MPTFTSLAEDMLRQARQLDEYLEKTGKQPTSFECDTMVDLSPEMEQVRNSLVNTAHVTKRLALGAIGTYCEMLFNFADEMSLHGIYKYNLASHVPLNGSVSFASISADSGMPEYMVERILRHAMSNGIFAETTDGNIAHTAMSRALIEEPHCNDAVGLMLCECSPSGARAFDAVDKWGFSGNPEETAWNLANQSDLALFQALAHMPERARRLGAGIRFFGKGQGWNLDYLVQSFDWNGLDDKPGATFVDIGGGHGAVSQGLAKTTHNIKFVVQDLPGTCEAGFKALPETLTTRVTFMPHDFFSEQPVKGADVYFFRWILHNWSDEYSIRILRAMIPALRENSRVVIYEFVLKDGPELDWTNKHMRNMDLVMQVLLNSSERTARGWEALLRDADPRLRLKSIKRPAGSIMSIIEASWLDT